MKHIETEAQALTVIALIKIRQSPGPRLIDVDIATSADDQVRSIHRLGKYQSVARIDSRHARLHTFHFMVVHPLADGIRLVHPDMRQMLPVRRSHLHGIIVISVANRQQHHPVAAQYPHKVIMFQRLSRFIVFTKNVGQVLVATPDDN